MPDGKRDSIEQLKREFWETMAKADALRNVAATLQSEEQAACLIQKAEVEENKAKGFLKQAEILARADI